MSEIESKDQFTVQETSYKEPCVVQSSQSSPLDHDHDHVLATSQTTAAAGATTADHQGQESFESRVEAVREKKKGFFSYMRTKEFYITLVLGQVLAIANTATSTFTSLLQIEKTSIPAFQTFFNYILLNLIFTPYTIHRYGFKGWLRLLLRQGWKYIILAFCDVEGNYFIVLSYNYTTMLSAQLINFWAIVIVVVISFLFLRVRYHITQILGILICIGGMGVLIASDHITGSNGGQFSSGSQVKGDMFALLGATFYGTCNVAEEFFVSSRPVYEVLGQMSFFAMIINGAQAGIFDRHSFHTAHWNGKVGGYITGYTLCLTIFYCLVPLMFRLSSAAFFNISMLTMNFWGVCISVKVLHEHIHWMYPIAFVCIIVGQIIYFLGRRVLGEAVKPWLGKDQERGISGVFTAKKMIDTDPVAAHVAPTTTATTATAVDTSVDAENAVNGRHYSHEMDGNRSPV